MLQNEPYAYFLVFIPKKNRKFLLIQKKYVSLPRLF